MTTAPTTEVQTRRKIDLAQPPGDTVNLKSLLEASKSSIAEVIPKHLTPDRMLKMVLIAASRQSKLLQCTGASILQSLMRASELGLDCSGTLGDGYLVPYNRKWKDENGRWHSALEAQFIPGYRGLQRVAYQSGQIAAIYAEPVYKADKFTIVQGLHRDIKHEPDYDADRKDDDLIGVYAVAQYKDPTTPPQFVYLNRAEIDKIRKSSKASDNGPWVDWFSEQVKKTGIRRLCKSLPLSPDQPLAIATEHENEIERSVGLVDGALQDGAGQTRIQDRLAQLAADKTATVDLTGGEAQTGEVVEQDAGDTTGTPQETKKPESPDLSTGEQQSIALIEALADYANVTQPEAAKKLTSLAKGPYGAKSLADLKPEQVADLHGSIQRGDVIAKK